jgi:hypothetical protein
MVHLSNRDPLVLLNQLLLSKLNVKHFIPVFANIYLNESLFYLISINIDNFFNIQRKQYIEKQYLITAIEKSFKIKDQKNTLEKLRTPK